jgi:hypothetical protein
MGGLITVVLNCCPLICLMPYSFVSFYSFGEFRIAAILVAFVANTRIPHCCYICRSLRRIQLQSRTMASGFVTRAGLATTICTRNTVTPPSMVLLNRCTLKWLPAIVSGRLASRSSRLLQSTSNSASVTTLNSSTSRTSGSRWCTARSGHQPGS